MYIRVYVCNRRYIVKTYKLALQQPLSRNRKVNRNIRAQKYAYKPQTGSEEDAEGQMK